MAKGNNRLLFVFLLETTKKYGKWGQKEDFTQPFAQVLFKNKTQTNQICAVRQAGHGCGSHIPTQGTQQLPELLCLPSHSKAPPLHTGGSGRGVGTLPDSGWCSQPLPLPGHIHSVQRGRPVA